MYIQQRVPAYFRLAQISAARSHSPELIRAWERRYGFPSPVRTVGGHRRHSQEEVGLLTAAADRLMEFLARDSGT